MKKLIIYPFYFLVGVTGIEPVTSDLSGLRSKPTELHAITFLLYHYKQLLSTKFGGKYKIRTCASLSG